jgi:hypothetical protein
MNELQIALIGLGAAAVAGVWAYNRWQERNHRRLAERVFAGRQPDALLGGNATAEPAEPVAPAAPEERREPVLAPAGGQPAGGQPAAEPEQVPLPADWVDELADCAVGLEFADAVPAPSLWAAQASWAAHLTKPLAWYGCDAVSRQWRRLSAHDAGSCGAACVALQLADRQGAVSDNELSIFLDGVRQVAQQFSALAEMPARDRVLMHARAVDEFCAGVDLQLGVNVVDAGGGVFAGTKLRGLAEAAGMSLADDGLFHAADEQGGDLFTLGNLGAELFEAEAMKSLATRGVTLSLDVPRVSDGVAVFDRLVAVAKQLAQGLGGAVVDGQQHPLSDAMIAGIREKIAELQSKMAARDIVAGSVRARRLFS